MNRKPDMWILWLTGIITFAALLLDILLARQTGLLVIQGLPFFAMLNLLVTTLIMLRMHLAYAADQEQHAHTLIKEDGKDHALFEASIEEDPLSARHRAAQFERWFVPSLVPFLCLLESGAAWFIHARLQQNMQNPEPTLSAVAFLVAQTFVCFVFSRFLLGLSRHEDRKDLRGPAIYTGLLVPITLLTALTALVHYYTADFAMDKWAAWALIVLLLLLALETVIRWVAWIYRAAGIKRKNCSAYESRLGAMLINPSDWVHSISDALDYQFGFSISQTWFYRFLRRALAPLILFQLLVLYLLSCMIILGPEEEAVVERLGCPVTPAHGGHLTGGMHLKWPWPFETVRRFPARRIQTLHIGYQSAVTSAAPYMLWTMPHHAKREIFLTAHPTEKQDMYADDTSVPVNMLSVHLPVQFCITNIYQYAYSCAEPQRLLKDAAQACLTREAVSHALFDLISSGQQMLTDELHARMQDTVNRYQLGIKIVFVGLQGIHPPVATADAFESVIGALEEKEAIIHAAKGSSQRTRSISRAEATSVVFNAQAYTAQRTALAAAEAFRFEQRLTAYSLSPRVLKKELYLRTLQQALNNTRKFIISAEADNEVLIFDFEKKRHPDLFDFTPSATRMMD